MSLALLNLFFDPQAVDMVSDQPPYIAGNRPDSILILPDLPLYVQIIFFRQGNPYCLSIDLINRHKCPSLSIVFDSIPQKREKVKLNLGLPHISFEYYDTTIREGYHGRSQSNSRIDG